MLGVVACGWRVKDGAGSQYSDQIILYILNSNIIINYEIITNFGSKKIFLSSKKI